MLTGESRVLREVISMEAATQVSSRFSAECLYNGRTSRGSLQGFFGLGQSCPPPAVSVDAWQLQKKLSAPTRRAFTGPPSRKLERGSCREPRNLGAGCLKKEIDIQRCPSPLPLAEQPANQPPTGKAAGTRWRMQRRSWRRTRRRAEGQRP